MQGAVNTYKGNQPKSTTELGLWLAQLPPLEIVEPEIPIVDGHHHLFGSKNDKLFYELDDLIADINTGHKVLGTVYIEAYDSGWRTDGPEAMRPVGEIEKIVGLTPGPQPTVHGNCHVAAGIVGFADLALGERAKPIIEAELAASQGRLRGMRYRSARYDSEPALITPNPPPYQLLLDPMFQEGCALLASFELTFDIWIYHTQIHEVLALADALPNVHFIVDHIAGPVGIGSFQSRMDEVRTETKRGLKALAERPNVVMKVGGLGMPLYGFGFEQLPVPPQDVQLAAAWKDYVHTVVEAFGTSRCMFESNAPVDKQSGRYGDIWNAYKLLTRTWSRKERADLFYGTACRAYRLPDLHASCEEAWLQE